MRRSTFLVATIAVLMVTPSGAQIPVIDPANLEQTILIAERTWQQYSQLRQQYELLLRMSQSLGNMDRFRLPSLAITGLDVNRYVFGRPWIQGMNSGDPMGTGYFATTVPLLRPTNLPQQLSAAARRSLQSRYATVEISDSVATMAGHQVALARGYHGKLQQAVEYLQDDVVNGSPRFHEMTAILDKIAAGELLGRRQDMLSNQLLSHALEQLLARTKRQRDTDTVTVNMQLTTWRDGSAANAAFVAGTGEALRTWRQP